LVYHQVTTFVDLFPFNGARFYTPAERAIEMLVNLTLMGLAITGTALGIAGLMPYAAVYYFVLFAIEIIIWWVPYFLQPQGLSRRVYNLLLALGTSDFGPGDTLSRWLAVDERIHSKTVTLLPRKLGRITPNMEHTVLHLATLATALATLRALP